MISPESLAEFLQALGSSGIKIGAREILWLHAALARQPQLSQDRPESEQLRDLLSYALVHTPEDRRIFEREYAAWCGTWRKWESRFEDGPADSTVPASARGEQPVLHVKPKRPFGDLLRAALWWACGALGALGLVWVLAHSASFKSGSRAQVAEGDGVLPVGEQVDLPHPGVLLPNGTDDLLPPGLEPLTQPYARTFPTVQPVVSVKNLLVLSTWCWLGFASLLAAILALARYHWYPWIPPADEPTHLVGPERLPLLKAAGGPELLEAEQARTLIWGVGRHVSETLTNQLDVDRTVHCTAEAAGLPVLEYEPEFHLREVWLWLDGATEDPRLGRYAREIETTLARSGLAVRVGGCDGYPQTVRWREGQIVRPEELEAHRQTALVAIFTDGEVLSQHARDNRRPQVQSLLRSLSAWQHLAFVDFSRGKSRLSIETRSVGVPCIMPEELPGFFTFRAGRGRPAVAAEGQDLKLWRAALAVLGTRPLDLDLAYQARRELGLAVSPWALDFPSHRVTVGQQLAGNASGKGTFSFGDEARIELLSWLEASEGGGAHGLAGNGTLVRSIKLWDRQLATEDSAREERERLVQWENSLARGYVRMERAIFRLWSDPVAACEELWRLRETPLHKRIRAQLELYTPGDCAQKDGKRRIPLPWNLGDQEDRTRYLLGELGLGGVASGTLRMPGRLGAGAGLLVGLGLTSITLGLSAAIRSTQPVVNRAPEAIRVEYQPLPFGGRQLYATARGTLPLQRRINWWQHASISGKRITKDCIERLPGPVEVWHCGTRPESAEPASFDTRRLAIVAFDAADPKARSLAATLIDSGTAETVFVGRPAAFADRFAKMTALGEVSINTQILWVGPTEPPREAVPDKPWVHLRRFPTDDPQMLEARMQKLAEPVAAVPAMAAANKTLASVFGLRPARRYAVHRESGIVFVRRESGLWVESSPPVVRRQGFCHALTPNLPRHLWYYGILGSEEVNNVCAIFYANRHGDVCELAIRVRDQNRHLAATQEGKWYSFEVGPGHFEINYSFEHKSEENGNGMTLYGNCRGDRLSEGSADVDEIRAANKSREAQRYYLQVYSNRDHGNNFDLTLSSEPPW